MRVHNEVPGQPAFQLTDPCPLCGKDVDQFEMTATPDYYYGVSKGLAFVFKPCGCCASDALTANWRIYRYAKAASYNEEVMKRATAKIPKDS